MGRSLDWQVGASGRAGVSPWLGGCADLRVSLWVVAFPSSDRGRENSSPPCTSGLTPGFQAYPSLHLSTSALHICPMLWEVRNSSIWCGVDFCSYEMGTIMSAMQDLWKDGQACKIRFCSWERADISGCVFFTEFGVLPLAGACLVNSRRYFCYSFSLYCFATICRSSPRWQFFLLIQLSGPDSGGAIYQNSRFAHITSDK